MEKECVIDLTNKIEDIETSMHYVERTRNWIEWDKIDTLKIFTSTNPLDLSAIIQGFILELQGECRKRNIMFHKLSV